MYVLEIHVNATEEMRIGESEPYEAWTDDVGRLFKGLQKEYGRCTGKVYVESSIDGASNHIGWVFSKLKSYSDSTDTYMHKVRVCLLKSKPIVTVTWEYFLLDKEE